MSLRHLYTHSQYNDLTLSEAIFPSPKSRPKGRRQAYQAKMLRQSGREIFRAESRFKKAGSLPCCPITEWETGRNETFQDSTCSEDTGLLPLPLDHRWAF